MCIRDRINSDLHHQVFEKLRMENIVIAFPQRDVHLFHKGGSLPSPEDKKANVNFEKSQETYPQQMPQEEPNEVSELVEDLPDILDDVADSDEGKEEENIAIAALMDELKLLRQEMNTINEKTQLSKSEEINSFKNQMSEMVEQFKDSENKQIETLKQEINSLKSNQKDKEDTKSKKDNDDLSEAQRFIKEIESRNSE